MALLASGRDEYRPLAAEYAKAVAAGALPEYGISTWDYGYETLFLAEYAFATKDASVMPGLTRLSTEIAHGASRLGTWGHFFARPDGIIPGYGCMNQVGVSMTLAMVVAREAGVKNPDVDRTIAKVERVPALVRRQSRLAVRRHLSPDVARRQRQVFLRRGDIRRAGRP